MILVVDINPQIYQLLFRLKCSICRSRAHINRMMQQVPPLIIEFVDMSASLLNKAVNLLGVPSNKRIFEHEETCFVHMVYVDLVVVH